MNVVADRDDQVARDTIMKLLSDEEIARVSTGEAAARLGEGAEYLDLQHLDRGVQRATTVSQVPMGHILARSAVSAETWSKILARLHGGSRANQSQSPTGLQVAASRLYHDVGFKIHLLVYLSVNALLIVINLTTTPHTYWFFWPLLGWGVGVVGHAFGVLRQWRESFEARTKRPYAQ
jgi:2TM domain